MAKEPKRKDPETPRAKKGNKKNGFWVFCVLATLHLYVNDFFNGKI